MTTDTTKKPDFPFPTKDSHEGTPSTSEVEREPSEDAIDQGVEETFPASDPVSVSVTKVERDDAKKEK